MGRIKTVDVKRTSSMLVENYADKFGLDFAANKKVIREMNVVEDKKMLNKLAGGVTRKKKINAKRASQTTHM